MTVSLRNLLLTALVVTSTVMITGCPLPFEYKGSGPGSTQDPDPSSPKVTASVVVSYSVQGGSSGTVADGGIFYSSQTTTVTLSTATAGAVIFYLDNGAPLSLSSLSAAKKINASSGDVTINRTASVQALEIHAIAIGPNMLPSTIVHATVGVSPYPVLSITSDKASVSEDSPNNTALFTITSSSAPSAPVTVSLTTSGTYAQGFVTSTATPIPASGGTVTAVLPQGATTVSIPIVGVHDTDGVNQTFGLQIQSDPSPTTTYSVGAPASARVVIQDDNMPVVTITGGASISDSGGMAAFVVSSTFAPAGGLTVRFQTGGTYEPGDVSGIPASGSSCAITLPASTVPITAAFPFTAQKDIGEYDDETVIFSLVADSAYTSGSPTSATVIILDSSPRPTLTLTADRSTMYAGEMATFQVTATVAPEADLLVNLVSSGYAPGSMAVPSSVTLPAGATSVTFPMTAFIGILVQTPQVSIGPCTGYVVGSPNAQSLIASDAGYAFTGLWDFSTGLSSSVSGGSPWVLSGGASIVDGSLSLPGTSGVDASTDISNVINQDLFTLGVGFRVTEIGTAFWGREIVTGGSGYRWLILRCDTAGNLLLDLDNHTLEIDLGSFVITAGTDHTLLLSIDRAALKVVARLDGVTFTTSLPAGFTWNNMPGADLVLMSIDESTGTTFKGLWHWIFLANGALN